MRRTLPAEAKRAAEGEGAAAKKLSASRTEEYFRERSGRANIHRAKRILKRAGQGKPPVAGDEM